MSAALTLLDCGCFFKGRTFYADAGCDEHGGDVDHDHDGEDEPGPTDDDLYDTSGEAHRPQINDAGERMY